MNAIVVANGLSKRYKNTVALDNASFRIEPGRIVGLIGPNGAGKTTALKAILGLTDFQGELSVPGLDPRRQRDKLMEQVCFIADVAVLPRWIRVREAVDFVANTHPRFDRRKCEAFLARTKLQPDQRVKQMSKGMIVQLHLALVMAIDARLLVLDEPTLGLDILYRKQFYQNLLEDYFDENKTIIVTTHQVEEVEHILTDLMFIRDGKIVLDADMDAVGERFAEVMVGADKAAAARQLNPLDERQVFGKSIFLFDGADRAQLEALGLTHHVLPLSRTSMRPWTEARSLWAIWRLFRRVRPGLVHAVTLKSVLYGGIAARLAGVPAYVAAISGLGYVFIPGSGLRGVLRRLALVLYRLALGHPNSRVIFQNTADRDVLEQAGAVRPAQAVLLRGSGVDLDRFAPAPWPEGPVTVAMASRLLHDKGVREFVEAARMSAARGEGLRWRLAGSLDPENPASVTAGELDAWRAEGAIEYVGECADVAGFYAQAHIVTLPSYREGLPKSLIEAAACGRPVVTTDVPGCRDAIEPGISGVLVPPRDARALADAVAALAGDEALRVRMGAAGRALAERDFGLDRIVRAHLAVYRELAGR